jgi:hypothetical protein
MSDLTQLLTDAYEAIVTRGCGHPTVCGDKACREAGHDHENYGEDGWCCGEECACVPACKGHEPETCAATTKKRGTAARLLDAIHARALAAHGESATGDVTREAPEIGHDCGTCAHGDLQPLAEPCRSCLHDCASFRGFTRWTAAPPAPSAPTTREACSTPRLAPKGRNGDESTEDHDAPDFCVCGVRMDRHAPSPSPADREESAGGGLCRRLEANGGGMCDMRAGHKGRCGTRISPQGHRRWFAAASPADAKEGTP